MCGARSFVILAMAGPLLAAIVGAASGSPGLWNDFHSYWYGARLLATGHSPYDLEAMRALAAGEHDRFLLGTGYSYPPPFAYAMLPLARLAFEPALAIFSAISIGAFGLAVGAWLGRLRDAMPDHRLRQLALLAGGYPPVLGSILNGQANLLVAAVVAGGCWLVLATAGPATEGPPTPEPRATGPSIVRRARADASGGAAIGLGAVVKLVPGVLVVPLWLGGRRLAALGVLGGFLVPLILAAIANPLASAGSIGLAELFTPDPFATNQSVNGFVSRLVLGSQRLAAAFPGAFDPAGPAFVLTAVLAAAVLVALWRSRSALATEHGLALGLGLALVAATAGAPKTSFWNETLVLVAAGLLLWVRTAAGARDGPIPPPERAAIGLWVATAAVQPLVWLVPRQDPGPAAALVVVLASASLYGTLALAWVFARRLGRLRTGRYAA